MVQVKNGDTILFLGDSITDVDFNKAQNETIGGENIYAMQVAEKLNEQYSDLTFYYKGIASNRSYLVYDRLTKDCIALKPDIIVLLIGVNDAWENYVPEDYPPLLRPFEPHMKEIFRRIKAELPNTKLITLLPFLIDSVPEKTPFHKVLDVFRENLKSYACDNCVDIVDMQKVYYDAQKTTDPYLLSHDGIHPTNLGHSIMANAVLEVLK